MEELAIALIRMTRCMAERHYYMDRGLYSDSRYEAAEIEYEVIRTRIRCLCDMLAYAERHSSSKELYMQLWHNWETSEGYEDIYNKRYNQLLEEDTNRG